VQRQASHPLSPLVSCRATFVEQFDVNSTALLASLSSLSQAGLRTPRSCHHPPLVPLILCRHSLVTHHFRMKAFTRVCGAVATWASLSACSEMPLQRRNDLPGATSEQVSEFAARLSPDAEIFWPGSSEYDTVNLRWSNLETPQTNVAVVPATDNDIAETVRFPSSYFPHCLYPPHVGLHCVLPNKPQR
jgi:hypothetical protein